MEAMLNNPEDVDNTQSRNLSANYNIQQSQSSSLPKGLNLAQQQLAKPLDKKSLQKMQKNLDIHLIRHRPPRIMNLMRLNCKGDQLQPLDLAGVKQNYESAVNTMNSNRTFAESFKEPLERQDSIQGSADDNKPIATIYRTARQYVSQRETRNHSHHTQKETLKNAQEESPIKVFDTDKNDHHVEGIVNGVSYGEEQSSAGKHTETVYRTNPSRVSEKGTKPSLQVFPIDSSSQVILQNRAFRNQVNKQLQSPTLKKSKKDLQLSSISNTSPGLRKGTISQDGASVTETLYVEGNKDNTGYSNSRTTKAINLNQELRRIANISFNNQISEGESSATSPVAILGVRKILRNPIFNQISKHVKKKSHRNLLNSGRAAYDGQEQLVVTADFSQEKRLQAQENLNSMQPILEDSVKIMTNQGCQVSSIDQLQASQQSNLPQNIYSVYSLLNMEPDEKQVKSGHVKLKDGPSTQGDNHTQYMPHNLNHHHVINPFKHKQAYRTGLHTNKLTFAPPTMQNSLAPTHIVSVDSHRPDLSPSKATSALEQPFIHSDVKYQDRLPTFNGVQSMADNCGITSMQCLPRETHKPPAPISMNMVSNVSSKIIIITQDKRNDEKNPQVEANHTPPALNTEKSEYDFQPHIDTNVDEDQQSFAAKAPGSKAQNCFNALIVDPHDAQAVLTTSTPHLICDTNHSAIQKTASRNNQTVVTIQSANESFSRNGSRDSGRSGFQQKSRINWGQQTRYQQSLRQKRKQKESYSPNKQPQPQVRINETISIVDSQQESKKDINDSQTINHGKKSVISSTINMSTLSNPKNLNTIQEAIYDKLPKNQSVIMTPTTSGHGQPKQHQTSYHIEVPIPGQSHRKKPVQKLSTGLNIDGIISQRNAQASGPLRSEKSGQGKKEASTAVQLPNYFQKGFITARTARIMPQPASFVNVQDGQSQLKMIEKLNSSGQKVQGSISNLNKGGGDVSFRMFSANQTQRYKKPAHKTRQTTQQNVAPQNARNNQIKSARNIFSARQSFTRAFPKASNINADIQHIEEGAEVMKSWRTRPSNIDVQELDQPTDQINITNQEGTSYQRTSKNTHQAQNLVSALSLMYKPNTSMTKRFLQPRKKASQECQLAQVEQNPDETIKNSSQKSPTEDPGASKLQQEPLLIPQTPDKQFSLEEEHRASKSNIQNVTIKSIRSRNQGQSRQTHQEKGDSKMSNVSLGKRLNRVLSDNQNISHAEMSPGAHDQQCQVTRESNDNLNTKSVPYIDMFSMIMQNSGTESQTILGQTRQDRNEGSLSPKDSQYLKKTHSQLRTARGTFMQGRHNRKGKNLTLTTNFWQNGQFSQRANNVTVKSNNNTRPKYSKGGTDKLSSILIHGYRKTATQAKNSRNQSTLQNDQVVEKCLASTKISLTSNPHDEYVRNLEMHRIKRVMEKQTQRQKEWLKERGLDSKLKFMGTKNVRSLSKFENILLQQHDDLKGIVIDTTGHPSTVTSQVGISKIGAKQIYEDFCSMPSQGTLMKENSKEGSEFRELRSSMPNIRKSIGLNELHTSQKLKLSKNLKDMYGSSYGVDGQMFKNLGVQTSARSTYKSKNCITDIFDENQTLIQEIVAVHQKNENEVTPEKAQLFKKYTNLLSDNEVMNLPLKEFGLDESNTEGNMVVSEVMNFQNLTDGTSDIINKQLKTLEDMNLNTIQIAVQENSVKSIKLEREKSPEFERDYEEIIQDQDEHENGEELERPTPIKEPIQKQIISEEQQAF